MDIFKNTLIYCEWRLKRAI